MHQITLWRKSKVKSRGNLSFSTGQPATLQVGIGNRVGHEASDVDFTARIHVGVRAWLL